MGLFSLFRSKKNATADETEADAPFPRLQDWNDLNTNSKLALARDLLEEVSSEIEGSKLKSVDDDEIELRGRLDDVPFRIKLNKFGWVLLEAKVSNRAGTFVLQRDHDKIPLEKEPEDDWADDDELRVFVAKGIFVEGKEPVVEPYLAALGALAPDDAARLFGEVERLQIGLVYAGPDTLHVNSGRLVYQLGAPVTDLLALAGALKATADALARGTGSADDAGAQTAPARTGRVRCAYCSTLFILAVGNSHCPNCGGPYTG